MAGADVYYACPILNVSAILSGMSPVVTDVLEDALTVDQLERAWHGPDNSRSKQVSKINNAQLTITRSNARDFQDRQVFLYVDGELWGKVKYGKPLTREIPPGPGDVRAGSRATAACRTSLSPTARRRRRGRPADPGNRARCCA